MNKAKIAIIGYGGMGEYHSSRIKNTDTLELAGVWDINESRNTYARSKGLRVFKNADDILNADIDGVIIATPNDSHLDYVEKFLNAKVGVMVEKPAAMDSKELAKMIKAADTTDTPFTVNQNRRYDADYLTAKEIIKQNLLGGVYRIESCVVGGNGIPEGWRKCKKQGGGMMLDWGVHLIDQMLLITESCVKRIFCKYCYVTDNEVEDGFWLELEFDNGLSARIVVETNTFVPVDRWRICGYNGTAQISTWDLKGKIVRPKTGDSTEHEGMRAGNGFTRTMAYKPASEIITEDLPKVRTNSDEIFKGDSLYDNFSKMLLSGETSIVKPVELMRVMKVMESAEKSARIGKAIEGTF